MWADCTVSVVCVKESIGKQHKYNALLSSSDGRLPRHAHLHGGQSPDHDNTFSTLLLNAFV